MLAADADPADPAAKGHTMTEQDQTPSIDLEDTEGHGFLRDEDDAEGHVQKSDDEDDAAGHVQKSDDEDDAAGHVQKSDDEDDAEGHVFERP
jgi:hypothetical protein